MALHWLRGLICLARDEEEAALEAFERELAFEDGGHLYGRECCANTWYAIGALRLRRGDRQAAAAAFREALARVAIHPPARLGLAASVASEVSAMPSCRIRRRLTEHWTRRRARARRQAFEAARSMTALAAAPAGNAGWLMPIEPLLQVSAHPDIWAPALARLRLARA